VKRQIGGLRWTGGQMQTIDTNIVIYALSDEPKRERAREVMLACTFASVQVLNEYAHSARRRFRRNWDEVRGDIALITSMIGEVAPITAASNEAALRIYARYQLSFYDALQLAVALAGGATIFYSEDMQHGLVIDDRLTIINPFLDAT
jgi:predicted nucleic acid-binding protein